MIYFIQFMVAYFATIFFAILFQAPKKELAHCGFTGGLGWIIYYIMTKEGFGPALSSATATFCLTIFCRIFAVLRQMPVTVYLLTGIFSLVPGAGVFYTAYFLFIEKKHTSSHYGIITFEVAMAITMGIVFGFAFPQSFFTKIAHLIKKPL